MKRRLISSFLLALGVAGCSGEVSVDLPGGDASSQDAGSQAADVGSDTGGGASDGGPDAPEPDAGEDAAPSDTALDVASDDIVSDTLGDSVSEDTVDTGDVDSGTQDAESPLDVDSLDSGDDPDGGATADGPVVYLPGQLHSPLTPEIAERLVGILAPGRDEHVFAKIGDSITVSYNYMHCFETANIDLAGQDFLQETIDWFLEGDAGGETPFGRESEAAVVGWSANSVIAGSPSALESELAAINPSMAVIMYGSNDIGQRNIHRYADSMMDLLDQVEANGTVPILSTIPPRGDSVEDDAWVPWYNSVVRGIAQARELPLMDYHSLLRPLDGYGLGGDRLHPSVYRDGGSPRGCVFTEHALNYGYNLRNQIALEALDRVRRVVLGGQDAPDVASLRLEGTGAYDDPFVIDGFPFTHLSDTSESSLRWFDFYDGCAAPQDESGPEEVYVLDLADSARLRAYVFDRGEVDIDLHILAEGPDGLPSEDTCHARGHQSVEAELTAGRWFLVADSWVEESGREMSGEYMVVIDLE